jgi:PmbA protein
MSDKGAKVSELVDIASSVVEMAKRHGADDAEVIVRDGSELTAKVRLGEPELVQEAGSRALGVRIFKDKRRSVTYTSDMRKEALDTFVKQTVELAELSEPDELNTLPATDSFAKDIKELELYDDSVWSVDAAEALKRSKACEKAALDFSDKVTNSDGASWSRVAGGMAFANSGGFANGYRGSYVSFFVEPMCDDDDGKKRNGYWWSASRYLSALDEPEYVGRKAAEHRGSAGRQKGRDRRRTRDF